MIYDGVHKDGTTTRVIRCDGTGDIGAGIRTYGDFVSVGIAQLDTPVGVGNAPVEDESPKVAKVMFEFNNIHSIDVVISYFEHAKLDFLRMKESK